MVQKMTTTKKLWIGIGVLVLLSPLGLMLPAMFGAQGAWGEWGLRQIEKLVGYVPEGMRRLAGRWKAPMPDYAVPGTGQGLVGGGFGYILSGVVGVAAVSGLVYLLSKLLVRKDGPNERK
jgi:cobalt/nickel transport protein